MVDFHTHILPQIDDGSRNIEESIQLLKEAREVGFDDIILTSHYCDNVYTCCEQDRKEIFKSLNYVIQSLNLDVNLYLASEIYASNDITDFILDAKASTINNSRYILFELPLNSEIQNLQTIIYKLIENKNIPIIAHPERYKFIQDNPKKIKELINMGVLFQGNICSIIGYYGKKAKHTMKYLLKNNYISFLGSDVHRENTIYPYIPKALKKIEKIVGKQKIIELTEINPRLILRNENI